MLPDIRFVFFKFLQFVGKYYPTILMIFPGTIITFFGSLPCNCSWVLLSDKMIFSISATDKSSGRLIVKRIFPLNERSEEHTSELQSRPHLVCRLLLEKKKQI